MIDQIPVARVRAGKNDRTVFNAEALERLASSIRERGLLQPITVRRASDWLKSGKGYEIVAGERRFRAVLSLGWKSVPALVVDMEDEAASTAMLTENVARADLDLIDEACAYQSRIDAFGWSVDDLADKAGVTVARVHARLKLLKLRPEIQQLVRSGDLQPGYAQILAAVPLDENRQLLAVSGLRDNPAPQVGWFRRLVNALYAEQTQQALVALEALTVPVADVVAAGAVEPPHPRKDQPPHVGQSVRENIELHAAFWDEAAQQWHVQGKAFPKNECLAAAAALRSLLDVLVEKGAA